VVLSPAMRALVLHVSVATLFAMLIAACETDASACTEGSGRLAPHTTVVSRLAFATATPENTAEGFDLDDRVSTETDYATCARPDRLDGAGVPGIDNELAGLFTTLQSFAGDAIDGLVQAAINNGTLLVMFRVDGLDDARNDACVSVQLLKGTGPDVPQLATTGFLAPSQTFDVDTATPVSVGQGYIEDGVLHAGPFEAVVPLKFFQVSANLRLHDARMRAEITEDGRLVNGVIGGGIEVDQLFEIIEQVGTGNAGNVQALVNVAPLLIRGIADLAFDGDRCSQASAALLFEAEPAYLLGDLPR
jgi:hypothetical protein